MAEVSGQRLLREREHRRLLWVDQNLVRLFYAWVRGNAGKSFELAVHSLYRRCGIAPLFLTFLEELRHFATARSSAVTIDKVRYDIWEAVASEFFGYITVAPAFIRLALSLCCYKEDDPGVPCPDWDPETCLWQPALNTCVCVINENLSGTMTEEGVMEGVDAIYAKLRRMKPWTANPSSVQLELEPFYDVFDVTEPLCQLFYTLLLGDRRRLALLLYADEHLARFCLDTASDAQDSGLKLKLPAKPPFSYLADLALSFLLHGSNSNARKPVSSDQLQQLETWLQHRQASVVVAGHEASIPASIVHKIIGGIKAGTSVDGSALGTWTPRCSELLSRVELHTAVVELGSATRAMASIFRSWLRCPLGQAKHQRMVAEIDEAYKKLGWPPCKSSSLAHEVLSTMQTLHHVPREQAQTRYAIWLRSVPVGVRGRKCETSFINLLAAVCACDKELSEEAPECGWDLVYEVRYWASVGAYRLLKPLLVDAGDGSLNGVALYLTDDLCYWEREAVEGRIPKCAGSEIDELFMPDLSQADFPGVKLPDATRGKVELLLDGPTVALCRDVTGPVLRLFTAWRRLACYRRGVADGEQALEDCLRIHGTGGEFGVVTEQDVEACMRASSDDPDKVVALVTGARELQPLVQRMLKDLGQLEGKETELLNSQGPEKGVHRVEKNALKCEMELTILPLQLQ